MAHPDASRQSGEQAKLRLVQPLPTASTALGAWGLSKPLANGFRELLQTAGAALTLEQIPGPAEGRGFQLDSSHNPRLASLIRAGVEIYPIQGLKGVLGGQSPSLNTIVLGLPEGTDTGTQSDALALVGRAQNGEKTLLVVDQAQVSPAQHGVPHAVFETTHGAQAMDRLLRKPDEIAAIITSPAQAGLFAAAGNVVAGTHPLSISLGVIDNAWNCTHRGTNAEDACGLTLACAWALFCAGDHSNAARLHNALLCALEDGQHTAGLQTVLPYSRTLENTDMLHAIAERLGASPRRLPATDYTPRTAAHLRQVG